MKDGKVREYIASKRGEIVESLITLAKIPSVRGAALSGAPFGTACREALEAAARLYEKAGFEPEISAAGDYLTAAVGNGGKTIGLFAHADVVPANGEWLLTGPFDPVEREGFLIGRGVCDDKSGIISSLFAARAVKELEIPFRCRLLLFCGSNEESGMADILSFAKENKTPDISLVPDAGFPVYRGEKSILRFWAVSREKTTLAGFDGGDAFNVVLSEASARLASGESLTERGIPKHAALPEGSVNAAKLLCGRLLSLGTLSPADAGILSFAERLLGDCYGGGFGIESTDPDFGRLTIANGMARLRGGRIALSFDARFGTSVNSDRLEAKLRRFLDENGWDFEPSSKS